MQPSIFLYFKHILTERQALKLKAHDVTLYMYLLNETNTRVWQQPLQISKEHLHCLTGMSKHALQASIYKLVSAKLIVYIPGTCDGNVSQFTLQPIKWAVNDSQETDSIDRYKMQQESQNLRQNLPQNSQKLGQNMPRLNNIGWKK